MHRGLGVGLLICVGCGGMAPSPSSTGGERERAAERLAGVGTVAIARDGWAVGPVADTRRVADGLVVERGGVREELVVRQTGHEQRWWFAQRPPGEGALELRVAVAGDFVFADERGLHFRRADGWFHYGHATWIDATGARLPLQVRHDPPGAVIEVPAGIVDSARYPVLLDPAYGAEIELDEPIYQPARGSRSGVDIASDGQRTIVTWKDARLGEEQFFMARLEDGQLVLPPNLIIDAKPGPTGRIASDGVDWLFAWHTFAEGSKPTMAAVSLGFDGAVGTLDLFAPPVAGTRSLIDLVAMSPDRYVAIHTFTIDTVPEPFTLTMLDGAGGVVVEASGGQQLAGFGYGLGSGPAGTAFATVGSESTLRWLDDALDITAPGVALPSAFGKPSVAVGDAGAVVAYLESFAGGALRSVYADTTQASAPNLLAASAMDYALSGGPAPALAWWDDSHTISVQRLDGVGAPVGTPSPLPEQGDEAAIAREQGGWRVAWLSDDDVIASATVDAADTLGPTQVLALDGNRQTKVDLAFNGEVVMATWIDERDGAAVAHAARLAADGTPLEPAFSLGVVASEAAVVAVGEDFVVLLVERLVDGTWGQYSHVVAVPVGADGQLGSKVLLQADGNERHHEALDAAVVDGSVVAVWKATPIFCIFFCADPTLQVAWLDPSAPADLVLSPYFGFTGEEPAVAAVGTSALVVWSELGFAESDIVGAWLEPGSQVSPFVVSSADAAQSAPAVSAHGDAAFVAWIDERDVGKHIYGTRLSIDGPLDPEGIAVTTATIPQNVALADPNDGHTLAVVWSGSATGGTPQLFASFLNAQGQPVDAAVLNVGEVEFAVGRPALAVTGPGELIVGYDRVRSGSWVERANVRTLTSGLLDGAACGDAFECASRVCEDAVCCNEACGVCERCGADGLCEPVLDAIDDTCGGEQRCDASGACKDTEGVPCGSDTACASGHCVDGFCCEASCGACERCDTTPGVCLPLDCGNYGCSDEDECLASCADSTDCAAGFQCRAGECVVPVQEPIVVERGCGCRVVGSARHEPTARWWLLLGAASLVFRRRRSMIR